jgi:hypothetical protein
LPCHWAQMLETFCAQVMQEQHEKVADANSGNG